VGPQFTTKEDGVVVVAAGKRGPKGGRPLGAGNKNEMQPRSVNAKGEASYGCRSQQFRGVYMCQRMTVRWRTQFSYARKVCLFILSPRVVEHMSCMSCAQLMVTVAGPRGFLWPTPEYRVRAVPEAASILASGSGAAVLDGARHSWRPQGTLQAALHLSAVHQ
jgi:hypothetical protein